MVCNDKKRNPLTHKVSKVRSLVSVIPRGCYFHGLNQVQYHIVAFLRARRITTVDPTVRVEGYGANSILGW